MTDRLNGVAILELLGETYGLESGCHSRRGLDKHPSIMRFSWAFVTSLVIEHSQDVNGRSSNHSTLLSSSGTSGSHTGPSRAARTRRPRTAQDSGRADGLLCVRRCPRDIRRTHATSLNTAQTRWPRTRTHKLHCILRQGKDMSTLCNYCRNIGLANESQIERGIIRGTVMRHASS